ncbi:MAG: F0F1 ATP synthase subunit A [Erysipelotrichaceae bacterium]
MSIFTKMGITFNFNGQEIWLHEELVNSFIVVIVLCIFYIILGNKIAKADPLVKPVGLILIAEIIYSTIDNLVIENMGERNKKFTPYIIALASFLALSNILGLFGLKPPTADYNVTLTLALITAFLIHYVKIKARGIGGFLKSFIEPMPLMLPMNIIDVFSTPISMSFRLFGNVISGVLIISLIYSGLNALFPLLIPVIAPVFHVYFDLFAGFLQTFIFIMLTMVFVGDSNAQD